MFVSLLTFLGFLNALDFGLQAIDSNLIAGSIGDATAPSPSWALVSLARSKKVRGSTAYMNRPERFLKRTEPDRHRYVLLCLP